MRRASGRRPLAAVIAGVAVAAVSACGTTVRETTTTTAGGATIGQGDGLDANPVVPTGTTPVTSGATTPATTADTTVAGGGLPAISDPGPAATPGTPTSTTTTASHGVVPSAVKSSKSTAATPTSAAPIPEKGQGWDSKYVYVGITTQNDVAGAAGALGLKLSPGNVTGDANAIIAALNAQGGLYGRQLKLVTYDVSSAAASSNPDAVASEACATFTQDNSVIGVVNMTSAIDNDTFRTCMAQHHTTIFSGSIAPIVNADFAKYNPYLIAALNVPAERLVPVWISRLTAQGFFQGWNPLAGAPSTTNKVKVGVIYLSTNSSGSSAKNTIVAALNAQGVANETYGVKGLGDYPGAELRFAADGVTHVLELDGGLLELMLVASPQHYKPRYGLNTLNTIESGLAANGPKDQLAGSVGIGWMPALDVEAAQDPGAVGPGETQCLAELAKGGQTFASSRFAEIVGLAMCDAFDIMATGIKAGHGFDQTSLHAGINSAGSGIAQGSTFVNGLSPTTPWVPGGARDISYSTTCSCFSYHGSTNRF